jgi:hypothetical protein
LIDRAKEAAFALAHDIGLAISTTHRLAPLCPKIDPRTT